MELIITFFIKFALGISTILTLIVIGLNKIGFVIKLNFSSTSNSFHKFSCIHFLFANRNRRLVNERFCRV